MKKPDNQRTDLEALRRQLRQEFQIIATDIVEEKIDELFLVGDDSPEDELDEDTPEAETPEEPEPEPEPEEPAPFVSVKFRNKNKIFVKPNETNSFGNILLSADGTSSVNVVAKIFDETPGIEGYKIRIKRID